MTTKTTADKSTVKDIPAATDADAAPVGAKARPAGLSICSYCKHTDGTHAARCRRTDIITALRADISRRARELEALRTALAVLDRRP